MRVKCLVLMSFLCFGCISRIEAAALDVSRTGNLEVKSRGDNAPAVDQQTAIIYITGGKLNRQVLGQQWGLCHNLEACPGCMRSLFPDMPNPFDDRGSSNCDGIHPWSNWFYHSISMLTRDPWEAFFVRTTKATLAATVQGCRQRFPEDVHCEWTNPEDDSLYSISGAYRIGTEFQLGSLDQEIDRADAGDAGPPVLDANWLALRAYVEKAVEDLQPLGFQNWTIVAYASFLMWVDASMENLPAKTIPFDEEFARKCSGHAFVSWQSWDRMPSEEDLLAQLGIAPFSPDADEAPRFVWEMHHALADILPVTVETEAMSWSGVKSKYRGREADQ